MFEEQPNVPEEHPIYQLPEDQGISIWRYMDLVKLISMLQEKPLYFCRADRLGDRFQCSLPSNFFKQLELRAEGFEQRIQDLSERDATAEAATPRYAIRN